MPDQGRRAPDWTWDEIVLACDLVARNGWRQLAAEDPQVIELSRLLQQMSIHPAAVRGEKFRNPNGVGRKTPLSPSWPGPQPRADGASVSLSRHQRRIRAGLRPLDQARPCQARGV